MTQVFLFLLFLLSLTVVPAAAAADGAQTKESSDVSELIARANAHSTRRLMHGDIARSSRRNAVPCVTRGCLWPKTGRYVYVPVYIAPGYSRTEVNTIIGGLVSLHRVTCIRFVWRQRGHRDYLHFYSGNGCWSYLGRQGGGQYISLKRNGCLYRSTVQHEILHALGFHHEQVRSDRDRYVRILTQNIQGGQEGNFMKVQTNNLGTPYDFKSVMHYNKFAFSKNGQPTIVAKNNADFGHATEMSANDIARINRLYHCWT